MVRNLLIVALLGGVASSCGQPREASVPFPPDDALTRAVHVLESFDYNVMDLDREEGVVRGMRTADPQNRTGPDVLVGANPTPQGVLWEVTVRVAPEEDGTRARYRLHSRATGTGAVEGPDSPDSDRDRFRMHRVPPPHLDRILAALADWRR